MTLASSKAVIRTATAFIVVAAGVAITASGWSQLAPGARADLAPAALTIESQDFEAAAFPPPGWRRVDFQAQQAGEADQYLWSRETCDPPPGGGSASAWAVGDGAKGSALACGAPYSDIIDSWLLYGPVDLRPYPGGLRVTMDARLDQAYDTAFLVCITTDDPSSPLSCFQSQELATPWQRFGPMTFPRADGQTSTEVWIGYRDRQPDGTHFGAFVDNVVIEGLPGGEPTATPTSDHVGPWFNHLPLAARGRS